MAPTRLEYLPQEILSRIAISGPAESVLALSKTCRTLQRACYDTLVFKAIIQSQRSLWNDCRTLDIPALSRYIDSRDTQAWARFALAGQRAEELREKGLWHSSVLVVNQNKFYLEGVEAWVPHLFVARHPLVRMPWYRLRAVFKTRPDSFLDSGEGIFCATAALLCTPANEMLEVEEDWVRYEIGQEIRNVSVALRVLCAFAFNLKQAAASERLNFRRPETPSRLIEPPSTLNILMQPIDSTYQLPIPFSPRVEAHGASGAWKTWFTKHVQSMSLPVYLEEGQWRGYYDYPGVRAFDPPMLDIQFAASQNVLSGNVHVWKIRAQGHDGVGRFTLEGWVETFVGRLNLRKTYIGAHSFDWECFMTPFGIFGSWGTRHRDVFHKTGRLWLWKREWNSA